eukprot:CAMPEP_0201678064 /NCGR_PEP_ID=MMETSP0494-20130426/45479_1 /ASSEMBLY_ACC=CAM_ASM_000839 /TAXON_ID=420259 /ORGANISM="Thalassiosira gravida, Strain GMp14c1" /LENGTH=50 /DNA_ID=CAMNT_0048161167 /DNA_START=86 /DNA_END=238 /DNA_ORIENTATION=+
MPPWEMAMSVVGADSGADSGGGGPVEPAASAAAVDSIASLPGGALAAVCD